MYMMYGYQSSINQGVAPLINILTTSTDDQQCDARAKHGAGTAHHILARPERGKWPGLIDCLMCFEVGICLLVGLCKL